MAKRRYAQDTTVPVARAQEQIKALVRGRLDAERTMFGDKPGWAVFGFVAAGRQIRIEMPLDDDRPQTERAAWRRVHLMVKARITEIQEGLIDLDGAFMPFLVLSDGRTFDQLARPAIEAHYATGRVPDLLPSGAPLALPAVAGEVSIGQ